MKSILSGKAFLILCISLLVACGSGESIVSAEEIGIFFDSPVIKSLEGITNALGEYKYLPGETVTFFIGDE